MIEVGGLTRVRVFLVRGVRWPCAVAVCGVVWGTRALLFLVFAVYLFGVLVLLVSCEVGFAQGGDEDLRKGEPTK